MKRVKHFFFNALILTAVSFIMRGVAVAFNVYVSNRVGAEAMGLFSLISGIYGFAVTLATSGINLAVVRRVSEALGIGDIKGTRTIMRRAVCYCLFFGFLSAFAVFIFSRPIGVSLLGDSRTVLSLRLFAFSLPLISVSSALSGYFTARRKSYKNALVNVCEQLVKIFLVVLLLNSLMPRGLEYACISLVLGGALSEAFSCITLTLLWIWEKARAQRENGNVNEGSYPLTPISLPVAFSAYARSALLTVEHALIPRGLKASGYDHAAALAAYGKVHSMAFPIVMFPSAFIYSFSGLLVPELAECRKKSNERQISYVVSRAFQFGLIFSIGVSGILSCYAAPIGRLIYPGMGVEKYVAILAVLIPVMYTDGTADAILKGLGFQVYSMNVNIFDSLLSILLVYLLLPVMGINGYIVTLFVCEILNAVLSLTKVLLNVKLGRGILRTVFVPVGCIIISTVSSRFIALGLLQSSGVLGLIAAIALALIIYIILLRLTRAINREDVRWLREIFGKSEEKLS